MNFFSSRNESANQKIFYHLFGLSLSKPNFSNLLFKSLFTLSLNNFITNSSSLASNSLSYKAPLHNKVQVSASFYLNNFKPLSFNNYKKNNLSFTLSGSTNWLSKAKAFSHPNLILQIRGFFSAPNLNGWGSYHGFSKRTTDENTKYASSSTSLLTPEYTSRYQQSVSTSLNPTSTQVFSSSLSTLKSNCQNALNSGQPELIKRNVLYAIESFEGEIDTQLIELYLEGLHYLNVLPDESAIKLSKLLKKYPLLASNLKTSQLIKSSGLNASNSSTRYNSQIQHGEQLNNFNNHKQNYRSLYPLSSSHPSSSDNSPNKLDNSYEHSSNSNGRNDGSNSDKPIHVVVASDAKSTIYKSIRSIITIFLYSFIILTFFNLFFENSGLIKTSNSIKPVTPEENLQVSFSSVQGCEEAKAELQELVEFLKNPKEFSQLGGKLPRGILLTGPPGTGKTLLARAVAGEADVPFYFMSGAEFDEIYVGVGSKRIRELFTAARENSPSIVFIDEIDAIGSKRNQRDQSYLKQTLNQLLVELDGFSQTEGVIFIAATNFPELLDPALTRPGRFDRIVDVPLPDVRGRISILKLYTENIPLAPDLDLSIVARGTVGFSGAELNSVVNIAAIKASREKSPYINMKHLEYAKDKILMGAERTSAVITDESRKSTAYHEGGHALVALFTPGALPLHKATVMPRGHALGVTVQLPELDRNSYTRQEYYAMLDVCMGGYAAENLIYGHENVTSGSSNDLTKATSLATSMVTQYGMSDVIGHVAYSQESYQQLSSETKSKIDDEIRRISEDSYKRVFSLLTEKRAELDALANALVEFETLDQKEIKQIVNNLFCTFGISNVPIVSQSAAAEVPLPPSKRTRVEYSIVAKTDLIDPVAKNDYYFNFEPKKNKNQNLNLNYAKAANQSKNKKSFKPQKTTANYKRSVRQGCPTSPMLFDIYINDIFNGMSRVSVPGLDDKISGLLFADDALILAELADELQKSFDILTE
ncbi:hypothetical protein BB561_000827 [Smittium simulii]|uniref:AAA+ ATPase domain-containing protein n=1 Tax=Smittium simulii TaxID=133385 RepID=A0A2T9YXG9_9FUNG|nr:hypothetical protein BB561_000827 [Smittium simulii]